MKKALAFCLIFTLLLSIGQAQNPINWSKEQLLEPGALAEAIKANKNLPAIISIGPGATIPHSVHIGMTNDDENLDKLKTELAKMKKDAPVVIYCGCCPFEHCPNVRPAIALLKDLQFTHYKLLNIPKNMKADWIDKGYPTAKQ